MLEHNSDVFRDCTAWKHPVCGRNWKRTQTTWQVCAHLLGARQAAGCFDAHKKGGHSHNWHRFAPSSTFVPALSDSHQRSNDGAWTAPCQLSVSFRGLEVQNPVICSYQSATVDRSIAGGKFSLMSLGNSQISLYLEVFCISIRPYNFPCKLFSCFIHNK